MLSATVRVGVLGQAADAPFHLAKERGYLAEEGLDLEAITFDSAQRMIAPLGADQLDAGYGAPGPGLVNANQRGINIRIVGGFASVPPGNRYNCLYIRKDLLDSGQVRGFADLRGRVYGESVAGNITTALLERELRAAGVRPEEVQYTVVPFPDQPAAFASGAIDFAFPVEPFGTLMNERNLARCFKSTGDMEPNFQIAVLLYGAPFAEQRSEAARRFTVAVLRALHDYTRAFFGDGAGKDELIDLLIRTTPVKDRTLYDRMPPTWLDTNLELNVDSVNRTLRWYAERGDTQQGELDLSRMLDPSFVEYALGRVGRY
jgi:NitT/TauT family transport system substrate-binding protein